MTVRAQSKSSPMITVRVYEFEHASQGTLCGAGITVGEKPWFSTMGSREATLRAVGEKLGEVLDLRDPAAGWPRLA